MGATKCIAVAISNIVCLVVWDKELKQTDALKNKIRAFVGGVMS